jgi:F0F1-type ATP synthase membrane subunit b/b'
MPTQKKRAARRTAPRQEFNPRVLLLAGVGAVSLGRKQAIRSIEEAGDNAAALRKKVDASVKSIEAKARKFTQQAEGEFVRLSRQAKGQVAKLRKQAGTRAVQLRKQAETTVVQLRKQANAQVVAPLQHKLDSLVVEVANQAESRFGPVLKKFAAPKKPARPAAKAARRRPARRAA